MSDVYCVFAQRACEDTYYRPYTDLIGIFMSKDDAIARARLSYQRCKEHMNMNEDDAYLVTQEHVTDAGVEGQYRNMNNTVFVIDNNGAETTEFDKERLAVSYA